MQSNSGLVVKQGRLLDKWGTYRFQAATKSALKSFPMYCPIDLVTLTNGIALVPPLNAPPHHLVGCPALSSGGRGGNVSVVGLYHGPHDSNVAVAINGSLVLAFPLSDVTGVPCFGWVHYDHVRYNHTGVWAAARQYLTAALLALNQTARPMPDPHRWQSHLCQQFF
jgi:hypothetical protein